MSPTESYPRDLVGYGRNPPDPRWPGGARVAVQFVLNYEEGGENNILHGDAASEAFLSDVLGAQPWPGQRHMNVESMYEYGSRAGFWRVWRMFSERKHAADGVRRRHCAGEERRYRRGHARGRLGDRQPRARNGSTIATCPKRRNAPTCAEAIRIHTAATGERPLGWYTGRSSSQHAQGSSSTTAAFSIRRIPMRTTCPIGSNGPKGPHLIIPYTLDANDMRFTNPQGFPAGDAVLRLSARRLRHSLRGGRPRAQDDVGRAALPAGRPARPGDGARALPRSHRPPRPGVGGDPARDRPPLASRASRPCRRRACRRDQSGPPMTADHARRTSTAADKAAFVAALGDIFEHAPWVAEAVLAQRPFASLAALLRGDDRGGARRRRGKCRWR